MFQTSLYVLIYCFKPYLNSYPLKCCLILNIADLKCLHYLCVCESF